MAEVLSILATLGVVYVVVESAIFAIPRVWLSSRFTVAEIFLYCPFCVGFWAGVLVRMLERPFNESLPLSAFLGGCIVMGVVVLLRAAWPDFLTGAHEREQGIIEELREPKRDGVGSDEPERGDRG